MWSKAFGIIMLVPILLILVSSTANFVTPCCEEKERISTLVDTAIDIMLKVKSENISCNVKPENITCKVKPENITCEVKPENITCPKEHGKPLDCSDLYKMGYNRSGVYTIWPISRLTSINRSLDVFCDMNDGGWTVIQRRGNFGRADDFFAKDWAGYKKGFGNIEMDFWLGNDNIFAITNQRQYSVYFALEDKQGNKAYAHYDKFWIDDEFNKYTLHISGYTGNANDAMTSHSNEKFSTTDQNNGKWTGGNCASKYKSGWWFNNVCYRANLNGMYNNQTDGIEWRTWKHEYLPRVEMKIRQSTL